ncbi:MAG: chemotaxis protein CheW [Elainellaceae cyanobacterium]
MELNTPTNPIIQGNQFILTQVGDRRIAFPTSMIASILLTERSQVLALPFYHEMVLGIVHHQGQLVTLMALQHLIEGKPSQIKEVFNALQLSESTGMPGLGLIVDQLLGQCGDDRMAADSDIERFQTQMLTPTLWQPRRWAASSP